MQVVGQVNRIAVKRAEPGNGWPLALRQLRDPLTLLHHNPGFVAHTLPVPGNAHREPTRECIF